MKRTKLVTARVHKSWTLEEAATLVTQSYLIKHVLGLHVESPNGATRYGKLAVTYSKESSDSVLQLTALRRLTWAYLHDKQPHHALKTIEQARYLIESSRIPVSPRVRSSIYGTVAVLQAKNGIANTATLHLAQEAFFVVPRTETLSHFDFSYAKLMRNEGLAYYHQGQYKEALAAYAHVIDTQRLSPKEPMSVSTHAELVHYQTMAALKSASRDMEQVITFWTADIQAAIDLQSQQRFEEACMAYEVMEGVWPGEPPIMRLRDLIVHW
jgi:tetratricopeptide (TPR) repeat protein